MPAPTLRIRPMQRGEIDFAVDLAAGEGWNPGLHDAAAFHAADAGGFLVGLLDETPIGCISAVRYGPSFGFVGFYIVVPGFRGRGYGLQLWQAALERLGARNVGLDGVIEQQNNYRKSGFELAYSNIRYAWSARPPAPPVAAAISRVTGLSGIAAYDRRCFPAGRDAFLAAWLDLPGSIALAWREQGGVRGYGVIRRCREGWKVGPLFADDRAVAEGLLHALAREAAPGEPVFLDVPEVNAAGMALAAESGMDAVFATARMYNRAAPDIDTARIFGVTTFELG